MMLHLIPHLLVKNYLSCHSRKTRISLPAYGRAEGDQGRNDKQSPNITEINRVDKR